MWCTRDGCLNEANISRIGARGTIVFPFHFFETYHYHCWAQLCGGWPLLCAVPLGTTPGRPTFVHSITFVIKKLLQILCALQRWSFVWLQIQARTGPTTTRSFERFHCQRCTGNLTSYCDPCHLYYCHADPESVPFVHDCYHHWVSHWARGPLFHCLYTDEHLLKCTGAYAPAKKNSNELRWGRSVHHFERVLGR